MEKVRVKCTNPNCGAVLNAPKDKLGQTAVCPKCQSAFVARTEPATTDTQAPSSAAASGAGECPRSELAQRIQQEREQDEAFKRAMLSLPARIAAKLWWAAGQLARGYWELGGAIVQTAGAVFNSVSSAPSSAAAKPLTQGEARPQSDASHDTPKPKLLACPACARDVSGAAAACPHCGHPIAKPQGGSESEVRRGTYKECCSHCGAALKAESESQSPGTGCIIAILGAALAPICIGIPIIIYGLHLMGKRRGMWRCTRCEATFPRAIRWYEFG